MRNKSIAILMMTGLLASGAGFADEAVADDKAAKPGLVQKSFKATGKAAKATGNAAATVVKGAGTVVVKTTEGLTKVIAAPFKAVIGTGNKTKSTTDKSN